MKYARHALKAIQYRRQYFVSIADQIDYILGYKPHDKRFDELCSESDKAERCLHTCLQMLKAGRGRKDGSN